MPWFEIFLFTLFLIASAALVIGSVALHKVEQHDDHPPVVPTNESPATPTTDIAKASEKGEIVIPYESLGRFLTHNYSTNFTSTPKLDVTVHSDLGHRIFFPSRLSQTAQSFVMSVNDDDIPLIGNVVGKANLQNVSHYPELNRDMLNTTLCAVNARAGFWDLYYSSAQHSDFLDGPFELAPVHVPGTGVVNPVNGARSKLLHIPDETITDAYLFIYIDSTSGKLVLVRFRTNELRDRDDTLTKPNTDARLVDLSLTIPSGVMNITKLDAVFTSNNKLHIAVRDGGGTFDLFVISLYDQITANGSISNTIGFDVALTLVPTAAVSAANLKLQTWMVDKEERVMVWYQNGDSIAYAVTGDQPGQIVFNTQLLANVLGAQQSWDVTQIMDHNGEMKTIMIAAGTDYVVRAYLEKSAHSQGNGLPKTMDIDTSIAIMSSSTGWEGQLLYRPQKIGNAVPGGDCLYLGVNSSNWMEQYILFVNDKGLLDFHEYNKDPILINHRKGGTSSGFFKVITDPNDHDPHMVYITQDLQAYYTNSSEHRDFVPKITAYFRASE